MNMKAPKWLRRRIEKKGYIPWIVRVIWPTAHWCPEMDDLLILDYQDAQWNCFCGYKGVHHNRPAMDLTDVENLD